MTACMGRHERQRWELLLRMQYLRVRFPSTCRADGLFLLWHNRISRIAYRLLSGCFALLIRLYLSGISNIYRHLLF